jgi:hypothetical protein
MNTQLNKNGHETTENPSGKDCYGNNPGFDAENGVPRGHLKDNYGSRITIRETDRRFGIPEWNNAPKVGSMVLHQTWADDEHPPGVIVAPCSFYNAYSGHRPVRRVYYTVRWNNKLYDTPEWNLRFDRND